MILSLCCVSRASRFWFNRPARVIVAADGHHSAAFDDTDEDDANRAYHMGTIGRSRNRKRRTHVDAKRDGWGGWQRGCECIDDAVADTTDDDRDATDVDRADAWTAMRTRANDADRRLSGARRSLLLRVRFFVYYIHTARQCRSTAGARVPPTPTRLRSPTKRLPNL